MCMLKCCTHPDHQLVTLNHLKLALRVQFLISTVFSEQINQTLHEINGPLDTDGPLYRAKATANKYSGSWILYSSMVLGQMPGYRDILHQSLGLGSQSTENVKPHSEGMQGMLHICYNPICTLSRFKTAGASQTYYCMT